jgi:hypothetical protein
VAAILLVGGSTRIPLVGTVLHRAFGRPPTAVEQPDLVVAYGSVSLALPTAATQSPSWPSATPRPEVPTTTATAAQAPAVSPPAAPHRWYRSYRIPAVAIVLAVLFVAALALFAIDRYGDSAGSAKGAGLSASPTAPSGSATPSAGSPTATPTTAALVIPAPFAGRWTGTARQRGGVVSSWTGVFVLPAGEAIGRLDAPTLGCAAELHVVMPAPTDRELHLRQRTTVDPRSTCAPAAEILMVINGSGGIDMFWQEFGVPTNTSVATLTRA